MSEPMEDKQDQRQEEASSDLSRRDFIAMAAAAGIVAATDSASAAMPVTETDVTIKTSDGTCDGAFIHPTSGSHPAVIVWSDGRGHPRASAVSPISETVSGTRNEALGNPSRFGS